MEPLAHPPLPAFIRLEAVDRSRNIARAYEIEWGPDLLGDWIVETRWGRIGRRGQSRTEVFHGGADAARRAGQHLQRRASSQRRIGVPYQRVVPAVVPPQATDRPAISWTTRLRSYLWIETLDGWVEDHDDAILAVQSQPFRISARAHIAQARSIPITLGWGLYADGHHIQGRRLFTGEWAADQFIATLRADLAAQAELLKAACSFPSPMTSAVLPSSTRPPLR